MKLILMVQLVFIASLGAMNTSNQSEVKSKQLSAMAYYWKATIPQRTIQIYNAHSHYSLPIFSESYADRLLSRERWKNRDYIVLTSFSDEAIEILINEMQKHEGERLCRVKEIDTFSLTDERLRLRKIFQFPVQPRRKKEKYIKIDTTLLDLSCDLEYELREINSRRHHDLFDCTAWIKRKKISTISRELYKELHDSLKYSDDYLLSLLWERTRHLRYKLYESATSGHYDKRVRELACFTENYPLFMLALKLKSLVHFNTEFSIRNRFHSYIAAYFLSKRPSGKALALVQGSQYYEDLDQECKDLISNIAQPITKKIMN